MIKDTKPSSVPWDDMINSTLWYTAYREKDAEGNVSRYILVIKDKNGAGLPSAVHSCHLLGMAQGWKSYRIVVPYGPDSDPEIDQLYVELKPVKKMEEHDASNG